jgi:hypothetical protein
VDHFEGEHLKKFRIDAIHCRTEKVIPYFEISLGREYSDYTIDLAEFTAQDVSQGHGTIAVLPGLVVHDPDEVYPVDASGIFMLGIEFMIVLPVQPGNDAVGQGDGKPKNVDDYENLVLQEVPKGDYQEILKHMLKNCCLGLYVNTQCMELGCKK